MRLYSSLLLLVLFVSCSKEVDYNDTDKYTPQTEEDIINYLNNNNLTATLSNSGLYYLIKKQGEGEKPNLNSTITVKYEGYLLDSTYFDISPSEGHTFNLQQVIPGFAEGITLFNEDGEGSIFIPPNLAYGSQSLPGIPGGSVLVFDIKLINVE